jgi:hypothetical protein
MVRHLRIEFVSGRDPIESLDVFIRLGTPILADFGYLLEPKREDAAKDWAHWQGAEFSDVIRAYAFRDGKRKGVSVYSEREAPDALEVMLVEHVSESTGWGVERNR